MSVYRSNDGRWRFRVTGRWNDGSGKRISGTAPKNENTKAAAQRAEAQQLALMATQPPPTDGAQEDARNTPLALASGEPDKPAPAVVAKVVPTLAEFCATFLGASKLDNKPSSIEGKESMLRWHILPHLGDRRLCDIDYAAVQDLAITLSQATDYSYKRTPRPNQPSTVNNVLACLKTLLSLAHKRGEIPHVPEFRKLLAPAAKFDYLTFSEADR